MDESISMEHSAITSDTPNHSSFADGDLGRIQGILIGDHARRVDERIATLEEALLGAIADLRRELQTSLEAVDQKVTTEQTTRGKAMQNLGDRIDTETSLRSEAAEQLSTKMDVAARTLRNVISTERASLAADTQRQIDSLSDNSVNRKDLAELFSQTAERLRDGDHA